MWTRSGYLGQEKGWGGHLPGGVNQFKTVWMARGHERGGESERARRQPERNGKTQLGSRAFPISPLQLFLLLPVEKVCARLVIKSRQDGAAQGKTEHSAKGVV